MSCTVQVDAVLGLCTVLAGRLSLETLRVLDWPDA